jgi:hypothetical protein
VCSSEDAAPHSSDTDACHVGVCGIGVGPVPVGWK